MSLNQDKPEFIKRKGGTILLYAGYQFYKQKMYTNGSEIWQCCQSKIKCVAVKCRGSITVQVRHKQAIPKT